MLLSLISLPWRSIRVPPIDLGTLQSFINQEEPQVRVATIPSFLSAAQGIGVELYEALALEAERHAIGDAFFTSMLYPQYKDSAKEHMLDSLEQLDAIREAFLERFPNISEGLEFVSTELDAHLDAMIQEICGLARESAGEQLVVGMTTTYSQLFSSLEFARRLKTADDSIISVLGGTNVSGRIGATIVREFPFVDYVVQGEGERPLVALIRQLQNGKREKIPAVLAQAEHHSQGEVLQLEDISALPPPNYDSYYASPLVRDLPDCSKPIALEMSRGCVHRCSFCSVPAEWSGYRWKSATDVAREMAELSERYGQSWFYFMDNDLPPKLMVELAAEIKGRKLDVRFAIPFRASVSPFAIMRLWEAGLTTAQLGIEGFSDSYLKRMKKGSRVIANLQALKIFFELGIVNYGNLLIEFPGATREEVEETYYNLRNYAVIYQPLYLAVFQLHQHSGVDQDQDAHHLSNVRNSDAYARLLPGEVNQRLHLYQLSWDYSGEPADWSMVVDFLEQWRSMHDMPKGSPALLQYKDSGRELVIEDRREGFKAHRLTGSRRLLYLYCTQKRRFDKLRRSEIFGDERSIQQSLANLVANKLMFADREEYLSLAVGTDPLSCAERIRRLQAVRV